MAEIPPFDPEWLAYEEMTGGRLTLEPAPVDVSRAAFDNVFETLKPMRPPPSNAVKTEDVEYKAGLRARVYASVDAGDNLPIGLYIHSGGWYAGTIENEDFICRDIAEHSKIILVSPEYRLAPENPYPAGLNDCCAAYEWMHANASKYGGNATKKFVMGGSAGGNLSACVVLRYSSDAQLKAAGLITACLLSCDERAFPEEYKARFTPELYADSPMINRDTVLMAAEWYACPDPADPLYSPLLHNDIKKLPPCIVIATEKDPTHQQTVWFYEEMKKQGVNAELVEWKGMPHFFHVLPMLKKTGEYMEVWNAKLRGLIATSAR